MITLKVQNSYNTSPHKTQSVNPKLQDRERTSEVHMTYKGLVIRTQEDLDIIGKDTHRKQQQKMLKCVKKIILSFLSEQSRGWEGVKERGDGAGRCGTASSMRG